MPYADMRVWLCPKADARAEAHARVWKRRVAGPIVASRDPWCVCVDLGHTINLRAHAQDVAPRMPIQHTICLANMC